MFMTRPSLTAVLFIVLSTSIILPKKTLISIFLTLTISAQVNVFTILPSIITFVLSLIPKLVIKVVLISNLLSIINPLTVIISISIRYISLVDPLPAIIPISIGLRKKLLNLVKIYIDKKKYSNCNNSFIFKLAIFHNICVKSRRST